MSSCAVGEESPMEIGTTCGLNWATWNFNSLHRQEIQKAMGCQQSQMKLQFLRRLDSNRGQTRFRTCPAQLTALTSLDFLWNITRARTNTWTHPFNKPKVFFSTNTPIFPQRKSAFALEYQSLHSYAWLTLAKSTKVAVIGLIGFLTNH